MEIEINDWEVYKEKGMMILVVSKMLDRSISSFITNDNLHNASGSKKLIDAKIIELKETLMKNLNEDK